MDIGHARATIETQHGIIDFIRKAAEVLAAAGVATEEAIGDDREYAIRKWTNILNTEACRLARAMRDDERPPATEDTIKRVSHIAEGQTDTKIPAGHFRKDHGAVDDDLNAWAFKELTS